MKLNTFFLMGATAMTMASGTAKAADAADAADAAGAARADAVWTGSIASSTPSSNLIITGLSGGVIEQGDLYVETDGKFTSSDVRLEARDYDSETQITGDPQANATWSYVGSQVRIGNKITQDANLTVRDNESGKVLTTEASSKVTASVIRLSVSNDAVIDDIPVEGEAQVTVQMSASYVAAL